MGRVSLFPGNGLESHFRLMGGKPFHHFPAILFCFIQCQPFSKTTLHFLHQRHGVLMGEFQQNLQILGKGGKIGFSIGLIDTRRHGVIKIGDSLALMHLVLVGLNGDAGQCRITADVVGLPEIAVPGGESAMEQRHRVNLTAGFRQRIKVLVVDVNFSRAVGLCHLGGNHIGIIKSLCTFRTIFQHGAHGGVLVDTPNLLLIPIRAECQVLIGLHQGRRQFPHPFMLIPIQNIGLCCLGIAVGHQRFLHQILYLLHGGDGKLFQRFPAYLFGQLVQLPGGKTFLCQTYIRFKNRTADFGGIKGNHLAAAFSDLWLHVGFQAFLLVISVRTGGA